MNLFGVKKKQEQSGPSLLLKSIEQLRSAFETLDKREAHLHKQMALALIEVKKKAKAKDKRGALFHLKRKKKCLKNKSIKFMEKKEISNYKS